MTSRDLLNKLHDEPFRPFRIKLSNSTAIDINDAGSVVVGPSSAILPIQTMKDDLGYTLVTQWRTVALSHMVEFIDLDETPRKRKRA